MQNPSHDFEYLIRILEPEVLLALDKLLIILFVVF